jgi:hypothetical protein
MECWYIPNTSDPNWQAEFRFGQKIGLYLILLSGAIGGMTTSILTHVVELAEAM